MRLSSVLSSLFLAAGAVQAATSWGFSDATVSIASKKSDSKQSEKFNDKTPVSSSALILSPADSLKIILTAKENGKGKKPHQLFLLLSDPETGLEAPFPFDIKDNGKAKVDVSQKDIPTQLLVAGTDHPLKASVIVGSFGSATPVEAPAFDLALATDPNAPTPMLEKPLRYGKMPEIHHIFRADPKNPPVVVSLVFLIAVAATVPALFIAWIALGANLAHLPKAMAAAPVSHALFFGSVAGIEGVFFLYYSSWNLFQMLPAAGGLGVVAFLSGMRALGEVQSRRLAGER